MKSVLLFVIMFIIYCPTLFSQNIQLTTGLDVYGKQNRLYTNIPSYYNNDFFSKSYKSAAGITGSAELLFPLKNVLFPVRNMFIGIGLEYPTQRKLTSSHSSHSDDHLRYTICPVYASWKASMSEIKPIKSDLEILGHCGFCITNYEKQDEITDDVKSGFYWAMGLGVVRGKYVVQCLYQVYQSEKKLISYYSEKNGKVIFVDSHLNVSIGVRL